MPGTLAVLCFPWQSASAQDTGGLITDRPDFTESTVVVPRGSVQVESGLTLAWDGSFDGLELPEALVRVPLGDRLEARFELPGFRGGPGPDGLLDSGLGVKVELGSRAAWSFATLAGLSLPTGSDRLSGDRLAPSVILVAGRSLGPAWSLGVQGSLEWPDDSGDPVATGTAVLGRALSDRVGTFGEVLVSGQSGKPSTVLLHHGYTLAVGDRSQLDLHAAFGLTARSPDLLVGAGWSTRF